MCPEWAPPGFRTFTHRLSSFSRRPPRSNAQSAAKAAPWRVRSRTSPAKRGPRVRGVPPQAVGLQPASAEIERAVGGEGRDVAVQKPHQLGEAGIPGGEVVE